MAFSSFPDVFSWIENLPPILQWNSRNPINSINLCPSCSSQPSLKLSINNNLHSSSFTLSIYADFNLPIFLWTSRPIVPSSISKKLLENETISTLVINFVEDVLKYSPNKTLSLFKLPQAFSENNPKDLFNFSFLSLTFIICIYEAPTDIRTSCLCDFKDQLACPASRVVSKVLMRLLGTNVEKQWIRSINLAITNWISELRAVNAAVLHMLSPLVCYSVSTLGMWKVQVYYPVIAMNIEKSSGPSPDERLLFSLNYNQLEGVIQLNYKVTVRERWIEVMVNTDNIRCDVIKLLTDKLMKGRGAGASEKHFPSRIALQITPTFQANVISVSVSKSSNNPSTEIGVEKGIEASFEPPSGLGIAFSAGETMTTSLRPWNFEQSVNGNRAILNWYLHDKVDGREVFSSKPSRTAMIHKKSWFKHRYSNVDRPFTREGGVIFAGDEYGETLSWKVDKACMGRTMEWEIKGSIWLTYWPNKQLGFYTETRSLEFREILHLSLL